MKKLVCLLLLILAFASCKEDVQDPSPHPGYTLSGRIVNGTTMEPMYPGLVMDLMVNYSDQINVEWENLGQCTVKQDGRFEIVYQHSELAQRSRSYMRFESQFYFSPSLPKNQDVVDTTIYESSMGEFNLSIITAGVTLQDTLHIAVTEDRNEHPTFITIPLPYNGLYDSFRIVNIGNEGGLNYRLNKSLEISYNPDNNGYDKEIEGIKSYHFDLSGDPFVDDVTLNIDLE